MTKTIVNSWNECDPLRHVIGGRASCACDLVVQHGFTTNVKSFEWLHRRFLYHRVHIVNFPGDPHPIYIDATFMPLRPGLILNNPQRRLPKDQRKMFEQNDWQIVGAAQPATIRRSPCAIPRHVRR